MKEHKLRTEQKTGQALMSEMHLPDSGVTRKECGYEHSDSFI